MIVRDVSPTAVADLAVTPRRAALAAIVDDEVQLLPVDVSVEDAARLGSSPRVVRVPAGTPDLSGRDAVVIADDGPQWFRLRALTMRGRMMGCGDGTYRLSPRRLMAWGLRLAS